MGMYTHWYAHTNMHTRTVAWVFIYVCVHTYTYSCTNAWTCAHDAPTWCDTCEYMPRCRHPHVCVPSHKHAHPHAYVCTPVHNACAHTCTCTSGHAHTDTRVCMHVDTLALCTHTHIHASVLVHARTHVHTALVLLSRLQWPSLGRTHISRFQTQHSCLHSSCSMLREATAKRK